MQGWAKGAFKQAIRPVLPTWVVTTRWYWRSHGILPKVFWPCTHTERILYRINFDRRPLLVELTDKAAVRRFAEKRLGPGYLPQLYHLTADPAEIDFDALPDRFVVKPTHGSGWVRIVTDKSKLDRAELITTCRDWLGRNYYASSLEWSYRDVPPRIIVEEFIDDGSGVAPLDYKFFVFHGVVRMIQVDFDRFAGHSRRLFDRSWRKFDMILAHPDFCGELKAPPNLGGMIEAAEKLGQGLDFIRFDFYDTGTKIYFGEAAVYPDGGWEPFHPRKWDAYFGAFWRKPGRWGRKASPSRPADASPG